MYNELVDNKELYYKEREKFDNSFASKLSHKQRLMLHPLLLKIISYRNKKAGFKIDTIYDKRGNDIKPKIFCVTHIGKYDIEIISEVIKEHYYLLSGDFENMKGTVEEKFLGLNGVVYIREDDKEDRKLSKQKMIEILKKGGNMLYFPEGTWNLSPNLPVLPCAYGIIEVAMKSGATIIPIGIEQYGKEFITAVGAPFDVSSYKESEKIEAIDDLRGVLAGLKLDIWEKAPIEYRNAINSEKFNSIINERLSEWTQSLQVLLDSIFKPKNVYKEEEVFKFFEEFECDTKNCFLEKQKQEYIKKYNTKKQ